MPTARENRSHRPPKPGTGTSADDGTHRLREHVAGLEAKLRDLTESYSVADRLIQPWERFMDGDRLLFPSGFPSDRKAGRNWPVIQTETDLRQARAFCRLIADTNPLVIAFLDHVTNFVVKTGFKWQVSLRGKKTAAYGAAADPDVDACQAVLDEFCHLSGWSDGAGFTAGEFDDDDYSPPNNLQHEGFRRTMRDGEFFLRLFRGGAETNGVPTCRVVEPECVQAPRGDTQDEWSWGILVDAADSQRRKAYHVVPQDGTTGGEAVPAGRVLHLKGNVDRDVKRGIPDFWPLQDEVQNAQKLWRNTLEVNAILAAIAYIRQHAPGVTGTQVNSMLSQRSTDGRDVRNPAYPYTTADRGTDRTSLYTRSEAGQVIDISNQMQYVPGPSATGTPGQISAMQAVFRIVGIRWGCPEYFSGDSSNANFASTLVSGGPFEVACQMRQQHYGMFQVQLAKRVLILACESGRLRKDQVVKCEVKVTPPAVAIANKAEDTSRRSQLAQGAGLSKTTWLVEEGYDPEQEKANREAEAKADAAAQAAQQPPPGAPAEGGDGLAALLGEGVEDAALDGVLLRENFTGQRKDKAGRMRCYQDGKLVPCPDVKATATATAAPKGNKGVPVPAVKGKSATGMPAPRPAKAAAAPGKPKRAKMPEPVVSAKAELAKATQVRTDAAIQRYAEEHVEPQFAKRFGGLSFPDSEPVDVAVPDPSGKLAHGIELKTMVLGKDEKLTMNAYAQVRKRVWREAQGVPFHTVAIDDRKVYDADGDHDETKRVYYYRRGIAGSARVMGMHEVTGGIKELKKLMAMDDDDLPDAAKVKEKDWLTAGTWVPLPSGERGFVNTETEQEVRPKK